MVEEPWANGSMLLEIWLLSREDEDSLKEGMWEAWVRGVTWRETKTPQALRPRGWWELLPSLTGPCDLEMQTIVNRCPVTRHLISWHLRCWCCDWWQFLHNVFFFMFITCFHAHSQDPQIQAEVSFPPFSRSCNPPPFFCTDWVLSLDRGSS